MSAGITFRPWRSVPLAGRKAFGRIAMVDESDFALVSAYRWGVHEYVRPSGSFAGPYARASRRDSNGRLVGIRMAALITGWTRADHINHDTLDNRRDNLRPATESQNSQNRRARLGDSSSYKGVFWTSRYRKWQAKITPRGEQRMLGLFVSEEQAARAYDAAALEFFGEFAWLNFPAGRAA